MTINKEKGNGSNSKGIAKDSDIEKVLRFLYARKEVSLIELSWFSSQEFNDIKPDDEEYGINYENAEENTKIFLPLGSKKIAEIILELLNRGLICIQETSELVWIMDEGEVNLQRLQPPGSKLKGKDIGSKVFAFVLNATKKGEELLVSLYGNKRELDEAALRIDDPYLWD